ncbi:hypothetical protein LEP1GSC150_3135 [Leptospira interrogans serovar Copenhageni str. LT2050]|nr:hypothetical protein LEP1GSC150_3135 [Leptospira interrogans serovar Copenhageni str. LT2050]
MTTAQTQLMASIMAISGGMLFISDDLSLIGEERLTFLKRILELGAKCKNKTPIPVGISSGLFPPALTTRRFFRNLEPKRSRKYNRNQNYFRFQTQTIYRLLDRTSSGISRILCKNRNPKTKTSCIRFRGITNRKSCLTEPSYKIGFQPKNKETRLMKRIQKLLIALTLGLTILSLNDCFISDSVSKAVDSLSKSSDSLESLSKSIKSLSTSVSSIFSSSSDDDEKKEKAYLKDVRDLTAMHVENGFQEIEFKNDLTTLALHNGLTNWKSLRVTYVGIGSGLKKAGVNEDKFQTFLSEIGTSNPEIVESIRKGFHQF